MELKHIQILYFFAFSVILIQITTKNNKQIEHLNPQENKLLKSKIG